MSEIKQNIQKNIALYRKEANLTQRQLAERLGVAVTNLASWEQGKSMPDIDTLFRLCSLLGVDILTISGFEFSELDKNKNAFAQFHENLNSMNHFTTKLGSELSLPLSPDEYQLVADYRTLNKQGQEYIRQTMYMAKQTHKKMPDLSDVENQA